MGLSLLNIIGWGSNWAATTSALTCPAVADSLLCKEAGEDLMAHDKIEHYVEDFWKKDSIFTFTSLGDAYLDRGDEQHAASWYRLAAAKGHQPAMDIMKQLKKQIGEKEYAVTQQLFNKAIKEIAAFYRERAEGGCQGAKEMNRFLQYTFNVSLSDKLENDENLIKLGRGFYDAMLHQIKDLSLKMKARGYVSSLTYRDHWDSLMESLDHSTVANHHFRQYILDYYRGRVAYDNKSPIQFLKQFATPAEIAEISKIYEQQDQYSQLIALVDTALLSTAKMARSGGQKIIDKFNQLDTVTLEELKVEITKALRLLPSSVDRGLLELAREHAKNGDSGAIQLLRELETPEEKDGAR